MDPERGGLVQDAEPPDTASVQDIQIENTDASSYVASNGTSHGGLQPDVNPTSEGQLNAGFAGTPQNNNISETNHTPLRKTPPGQQTGVVMYTGDGARVVISPARQSVQPEPCPVKEKNIKFFYIFSAISIAIFFPTGIFALIFAIKMHREFRLGAASQSWVLTRKFKKRCQNSVIFSFIGFFVTLAIVVAVLEQVYFHHDDEYWDNRFQHHSSFG